MLLDGGVRKDFVEKVIRSCVGMLYAASMHRLSAMIGGIAAAAVFSSASLALAHGGDQRVVERAYIVHFTGLPLSPLVGEAQQGTLALSDLEGNFLSVAFTADLEIRRNDVPLWSLHDAVATGGLLSFSSVYPEEGTYELFVTFRLPDDPEHVYEPDDFMIQARAATVAPEPTRGFSAPQWIGVIVFMLLAFGAGFSACASRRKP